MHVASHPVQPLHYCLAVGRTAWDLLADFIGRHWLFGLVNAILTALIALGLLYVAGRLWPLRSYPVLYLRLKRLVYLFALFKGTFDLVMGDSMYVERDRLLAYGCQFSPMTYLELFRPLTHFSIWEGTRTTLEVTLVMGGIALVLLVVRVSRVAAANRALTLLDQIWGVVDPRTQAALKHAAETLKIDPKVPLPKILLVEVECATPLLLGVRQPRLILSPTLVAILTEDELEMALRHELAHLKRRDHWWRWIQLWIEDLGRPIFVASRLGAWSVETEELLCDRLAVSSPHDAACLAKAITKAASLLQNSGDGDGGSPGQKADRSKASSALTADISRAETGLKESVVPSLLGRHRETLSETASLNRRIRELLVLSHELSVEPSENKARPSSRQWVTLARHVAGLPLFLFVTLLLFGVLYARFHLLLNVR